MMKYILITILMLVSVQCFAQYNAEWACDDDAWDLIYFESAALGTIALDHLVFKDSYWKAYLLTIGIALLKEFGDSVYREGYFWTPRSDHWFWDSRGGSIRDVGLAGLSISISFPLRGSK